MTKELTVIAYSNPEEVLRLKETVTEEGLKWLALQGISFASIGSEDLWEHSLKQAIKEFNYGEIEDERS